MTPITISLEGATEAIDILTKLIIPWRRKHAQAMTLSLELEKKAEIEKAKAELLKEHALVLKEKGEVEKILKEIEKIKLKNEKLQWEIRHQKIELASNILEQAAPNLSETEKLDYMERLLPSIDTLVSSNIEFENTST